MTETPAETQPAPSSTGDGARRNPDYVYTCELCGEPVALTHHEYDDLVEKARRNHRNREPRRLGVRVRCEAHAIRAKQLHASKVRAPNTYEPRHMPPVGAVLYLATHERIQYGATVTIRDVDDNRATIAKAGPVGEAIAEICAEVDALNDLDPAAEWRILTISTPASIYGDLQGMRGNTNPEVHQLGRAHRLDLLYKPPSGYGT